MVESIPEGPLPGPRSKGLVRLGLTIVSAAMCSTCTAGDTLPTVLAGRVVGDIIQDLDRVASNLIIQASNQGNVLLANAAGTGSVAAANAAVMFREQVTATVRELNPELRSAITGVNNLAAALESAPQHFIALEKAATLDTLSVLARLGGEKFYVERIDGVSQLQGRDHYKLRFVGVGVGAPSQDQNATNTLIIGEGGEPLHSSQPTAHEAIFQIPPELLQPYFDAIQVRTVPATIRTELNYRTGIVFKTWKTEVFETRFLLSLVPARAGTLQLTGKVPHREWRKINSISEHVQTGDYHCNSTFFSPCTPTSHQFQLNLAIKEEATPGSGVKQRLANARLTCYSGPCAWSNKWAETIAPDGLTAKAVWDVNSRPTQWEFSADVEDNGTEHWNQLEQKPLEVRWNEVYELPAPADAKLLTLVGKLLGEELAIAIEETVSPDPRIVKLGDTKLDSANRVIQIRLQVPKGLVSEL